MTAGGFIDLFAGGPATIDVGDLSGDGVYLTSLGNITTGTIDSTQDVELIRQKLVAQIYSPVPWVATMQAFASRGVTRLLEFGPGKVLTGLNKRIDERLDTSAVNDVASLQQALDLNKAA